MYAAIRLATDAAGATVSYRRVVREFVRRLRSVDMKVLDVVLALVLAVVSVLSLVTSQADPPRLEADPIAYALAVTATGAIAWRSRWPFAVLLVSTGATVVLSVSGYAEGAASLAVLVAFYSVAAGETRRSRLVGAAVLLAAFAVLYAFNERSGFTEGAFAANTVLFSAAWVAGEHTRSRRVRMVMLEERAAQIEREQEERERRAIADERLRIAQDLHDVVAHAMSVITVQAGVGAHVIDAQPHEAKKALAAIEATGRAALQELRLMVGVLRQDGDQRGVRAPAPSRANIEQLVQSVREAGLPVELRWEGDVDTKIPLGLYPSCYRIVQEALTNALKHAGTASATVTVAVAPSAVTIEVVDDGRGAASSPDGRGGGFGLIGMHERASVLGGTLRAGPRPGGGFAVRAHLPFAPAAAGSASPTTAGAGAP
jgi:signal transduction histidine kinase